MPGRPLTTIIVADDDDDDRMLIEDAFLESRLANPRVYCEDGEQLMAYLRGLPTEPIGRSELVLLDLNMPKLDGRGVLAQMKADPVLRRIPIVVFTTSRQNEDILRTYDLGVNAFITKPVNFEGLLNVVSALKNFWLDVAQIPVEAA